MKITPRGAFVLVELPFVAAVSVGHDVVVLELLREGGGWLDTTGAEAVVDAGGRDRLDGL